MQIRIGSAGAGRRYATVRRNKDRPPVEKILRHGKSADLGRLTMRAYLMRCPCLEPALAAYVYGNHGCK